MDRDRENRRERGAALLRVHHWALDGSEALPEGLTPMSLDRAADVIGRAALANLPGAASQRVRAISMIAARGLGLAEAQSALEILDAPTLEIGHFLEQHPVDDPRVRESLLDKFLQELIREKFCPRRILKTDVKIKSGVVDATATIEVLRNFADVAASIDPQQWDDCSVFFIETYKTAAGSFGTPKPSNPTPPAKDAAPPQPGTNWSGHFFEHFSFVVVPNNPNGISEFENTIEAKCLRWNPQTHRIDYLLHTALWSKVLGGSIAGGLGVDEGHLEAADVGGGWTRVTGRKVIQFTGRGLFVDKFLNDWAASLLWAMGSELAEMSCCGGGTSA